MPLACPPPTTCSRRCTRPAGLDLEPGADRVAVAAVLAQAHLQPMADRLGAARAAGTDIAPELRTFPAVDDDGVEQAVAIQVDHQPAAPALVVQQPGIARGLDVASVGAAEQQVARVEQREVGHVADVALHDEEVRPAVVVDVRELRMPGGRWMHVAAGEGAVRR